MARSKRPPEKQRLRLRPFLRLFAGVCRAHAGFLILTALAVVVPVSLLDVLADRLAELAVEADIGSGGAIAAGLFGIVVAFGALAGHQLYAGLVGSTVAATRAGRPRPSGRAIVANTPVLRLIAADLVYAVAVGVGTLLLFVPGLLAATWFALAGPVLGFERRSLRSAFRRSRELVRGHFWTVFWVVFLVGVVSEVIVVEQLLLAEAGLDGSLLGAWLSSALGDLLTAPIYGVALTLLALELGAIALPVAEAGEASAE